jgi:hypothetical protein
VTDESPPTKRAPTPPPEPPEDDGENERPTINPPFDVEAYARAASSTGAVRKPSDDTPTRPPPAPMGAAPGVRPEQVTLTNEVELERARAQSAVRSEPPGGSSPSVLSVANARAPSAPSVPAPGHPLRKPSPTSIEAAVLGALSSSPAPDITERTIEDPVAEMRERFSLGDYTGALEMAELILADEPDNLEAAECGENCRSVLENMYAARLGPLDRVPTVVVPRTQMRWLSMDHRAGFVLSLIDGTSSVEMILDVCGMPKLDALRILQELVQQKVVSFK